MAAQIHTRPGYGLAVSALEDHAWNTAFVEGLLSAREANHGSAKPTGDRCSTADLLRLARV